MELSCCQTDFVSICCLNISVQTIKANQHQWAPLWCLYKLACWGFGANLSPPLTGCSPQILAAFESVRQKWQTPLGSQKPQSPHCPEKRGKMREIGPSSRGILSLTSQSVSSSLVFVHPFSLCRCLYSHLIYDSRPRVCPLFKHCLDLWWRLW